MRQTSLSQCIAEEVDVNDEAKSDIEVVARKVVLSRQRLARYWQSEEGVERECR